MFVAKKREGNGGVRFTYFSWPVNRHSGTSAVGGNTASATLQYFYNNKSDHDGPHMYGRGTGQDASGRYVSNYWTKPFSSAEAHISCLSNKAKITSSKHTNFVIQGKVILITAVDGNTAIVLEFDFANPT